jgi:Tol biopolymer transport system component
VTALTTIAAVGWAGADAAAAAPLLISATPAGAAGNGLSGTFGLAVSADGDTVAFSSMATDLGPRVADATPQIYVRRLSTATTTLASHGAGGVPGDALSTRPSVSADGNRVAFLSSATNLDPRDADQRTDAYVATLSTGRVELVSTSGSGAKADAPTGAVTISADGRTIAFTSPATNLGGAAGGSAAGVYVKDLASGAVTQVAGGGELGASGVSLSSDGTDVAFSTDAALASGDGNGRADVYVKDLTTGRLTLASATADGVAGSAGSTDPALQADGSAVVFASFASNLDPNDDETGSDIYRKDLRTGTLALLSTATDGEKADASSSLPSVSGDGRFVSFASYASNLDPRAAQGRQLDVYVKDTESGAIQLASASANGTRADGTSLYSALTGAGSNVVFTSNSTTLSPRDTNRLADVYAFDPFPAAGPPPVPGWHHHPGCGHRGAHSHRRAHGRRCKRHHRCGRHEARGRAAARAKARRPRL